jgi:hypothetical protein
MCFDDIQSVNSSTNLDEKELYMWNHFTFIIFNIIICIHLFLLVISYNQPKLSSCAAWDLNANTFATDSSAGSLPYGLFVDGINNVYVPNSDNGHVLVWPQGSLNPIQIIFDNFSYPKSLFVSITDDIFVDTGYNRVDAWAWNSMNSGIAMNTSGNCYGLFIDINNTLYCTVKSLHQVVKLSLNSTTQTPSPAAGNGSNGSESYMLNYPQGIFVDINFDLYVADCGNDRIQLFQLGQLNGTTMAGSILSNTTITLHYPTGVVLDVNRNLFIVDSYNHRIVTSGPNGSRCLVGCSGSPGSSSSELNYPQSIALDSYGNMFVSDRNNSRIQMFILATNSCGKYEKIVEKKLPNL